MTVRLPGRARVAVIGDAMMDVTARIDSDIVYASDTPAGISLQPGGSGSNTAAWLGYTGIPVAYIGSVGSDAFGAALTASLRAVGVDCRVHRATERPTGTCIVIVDGSGERTMFPDPGANSLLTPDIVEALLGEHVDHVHLSGYTILNPASREAGLATLDLAQRLGCSLSFDTASVGPLESCVDLVRSILPRVDVLLANAAEAAVLVDTHDPEHALSVLHEKVPTVVIKLGPRGAIAATADDRLALPAVPVEVIDTTGAGDAFAAGFLPSWLAGAPLGESLAAALELAGQAVGRVGAGPPQR
jgi:sugar/nucleoside kinase (ribokinase family)